MQVLIIDDIDTNLVLLEQMLIQRFPDCDVTCQNSAVTALAWCAENEPDLVLVDYMMPDMDGIEFIRAFRNGRENATVPIVMVTAAADRDVRRHALEAGATDFITKPIDPVEVRARLNNLLTLRRSQTQLRDRAAWLAEEVGKATHEILAREEEMIFRLAKAVEYRDPETGMHVLRMALYSRLIAQRLGFSEDQQQMIFLAAPMHDVGKVATPDRILLKPGRLDPDELRVMRSHAAIGHEILKNSSSRLVQLGAKIALTHHERWDGAGYPSGLAGEDIPVEGRIVAVADVFDALTSARPYKPAWGVDRARDLLVEQRGKHFDPACVDAFLDAWKDVLDIRAQHADPEQSLDELLET